MTKRKARTIPTGCLGCELRGFENKPDKCKVFYSMTRAWQMPGGCYVGKRWKECTKKQS
jgi:hypothetical protein